MRALAADISASLGEWSIAWWKRILHFRRRTPKRLRLCESLPLGDRRFIAVVEFDSARFLVGGTPSSLVLLSELGPIGEQSEPGPTAFSEVSCLGTSTEPTGSRRGEAC